MAIFSVPAPNFIFGVSALIFIYASNGGTAYKASGYPIIIA